MSRRLLWFRLWLTHRVVRPWALLTPVLVIAVAMPLLRPLRAPGQLSNGEWLLLQTVRALRTQSELAIDAVAAAVAPNEVIYSGGRVYAAQPPGFALLLTVPDWLLARCGIRAAERPDLHEYLLTLLGVTLPVAVGAGAVYRLGRLFDLARPARSALALMVVFGCGWLSYATMLNAHAVSAALLVCATALLARSAAATEGLVPLMLAAPIGLLLGLSMIVEPVAMVVAVGVLASALTVRFRRWTRLLFPVLLLVGAIPPLLLHSVWVAPITGDVLPGVFHPELTTPPSVGEVSGGAIDEFEPRTFGATTRRWVAVTVGSHGVLSHFPVIVLAIAGVFAVMHRHWPTHVKVLAAGSLFAVVAAVVGVVVSGIDLRQVMFANRFAVVALPTLALWAGAWARRSHHPATWSAAVALLVVSIFMTLLGATSPMPPGGYERFTAWEAARRLFASVEAHAHDGLVMGP